jgi:putative transposase
MADASPKRTERVWQRNYYDHIIRNQLELDRVRQYIADNPHQWVEDQENPEGSGY